ncbi:MAG: serine protease [Planctomycetaceae bacterium]|nr:serine protease [Planctomycetaceae bacterium]
MQVTPTSIKAVPLPNLRSHIVLVREAEASGKEANQKPILFKGVIIDSEGYIAVPMLPEMAKIFVVTIGNQQETKGELVAVDESYRIGLIKISLNEPLPAIGFNSDYKPQVSDKALIVPSSADEPVRRGQITSVEFNPSEESQANFILCDIACPLSMFGSLLVSEEHIPLGIVLASRMDFAPGSMASNSQGLHGKPLTVAVPLPAIATLLQAARSNPKAALVRIPISREVDLDKPVAITLEPIAPQAKSIVESFADRGAKILEYVEGKRLKVEAPPQIIAEINKALQATIRPATEGGSNRNEEPKSVSPQ